MLLSERLRRIIILLFHLLLFLTPLIWTSKTSELFELPKMYFVYTLTLLITSLWLARMIVSKRLLVRKTPFDLPLLLFLASQIISTILSIHPRTSLFGYYSRFNGGLLSTISYLTLYYAFVSNVRNENVEGDQISAGRLAQAISLAKATGTKKLQFQSLGDQRNFGIPPHKTLGLLTTLLTGGLVASLYAIPEHFGISPSCLIIRGTATADCWVQDVVTRVFGTFGQPNWLGAFLVTILPLSLIPLIVKKSLPAKSEGTQFLHAVLARPMAWLTSKVKKDDRTIPFTAKEIVGTHTIATITPLIFFTTLLFTKSRSGLLGLTLGLGFLSLTLFLKSVNRRKTLKLLATGYSLMAILFILFGRNLIPQLNTLFQANQPLKPPTPNYEVPVLREGGTESGDIRRIVWKGAIEVWKRYPIFGSGVETFAYSYYNVRPVEHNLVSEWDFLYNKAHNEFLNLAATTGAFGLGSYLLIIISYSIWSAKTIFKSAGDQFSQSAWARLSAWLTSKVTRSTHFKPFTAKKSAGTRANGRDTKNSLILAALLTGYFSLAVSNFFGFSTVPVSLLFFLFPAFAYSLVNENKLGQLGQLEIRNSPTIFNRLQIGSLSILLLITSYLLLSIPRFLYADHTYKEGKSQTDSSEAIRKLNLAAATIPNEPVYHSEFALAAAKGAVELEGSGQATAAASLAAIAVKASDTAISLNPVHVPFYKDRAIVLTTLTKINPNYIYSARETLVTAAKLAPTDAKLWFNLGIIDIQLDEFNRAEELLAKTLTLKPNYEHARYTLGLLYEDTDRPNQAMEQYRYSLENINPGNTIIQNRLQFVSTQPGIIKE